MRVDSKWNVQDLMCLQLWYCDIDMPSKVNFIYFSSADALGKCHNNWSRETSWSDLLVSKLKLIVKQMADMKCPLS